MLTLLVYKNPLSYEPLPFYKSHLALLRYHPIYNPFMKILSLLSTTARQFLGTRILIFEIFRLESARVCSNICGDTDLWDDNLI